MKVLLISPEYPPYHLGGGGVVVQNLARNFVRKGHEVTVVAGYYPTKSIIERVAVTEDRGVEVFWLPLLPTPHVSFQLKTIMPTNVYSSAFLSKLFHNHYDIINIHGYGHFLNDLVALHVKLLHKKYVATIHGIPKQPERQSGVLGVAFEIYSRTVGRVFLNWASVITVVSKHTAQDTVVYGGNMKKIVVIPNGVNFKAFAKPHTSESNAVRRRYQLEKKRLVLGVGRLSEAKGFQFLLKAMPRIVKEVPNVHLLIAGADCGYRNELVKITDDLGLNDCVGLIGEVKEEAKRALYSVAEIIVVPSITEPFGLVALEAMAAGKPIVASRVDGLIEIVRDERTGILVEPADSDGLARAVTRILGDSGLWHRLSVASREAVSMYDWNRIANDYMKIYTASF